MFPASASTLLPPAELSVDLCSSPAETLGGQKLHISSPLDLWVKIGGHSSEVASMGTGVE